MVKISRRHGRCVMLVEMALLDLQAVAGRIDAGSLIFQIFVALLVQGHSVVDVLVHDILAGRWVCGVLKGVQDL